MMNSASWRRMRLAVRLVGAVLLSVHGARAAELSGDLVVTGKVGVGVSEPAYRLDVGGDINLTGDLLKNGEPLSLGNAGGVSNVTATAPLSSTGGTEPNLSIQAAGAAQAGALSSEDWTRFDAAHGWGNHATNGYLTTYTETDPLFAASTAAGLDAAKVANWNAAYGWGDHALAGYLTSFTETDPLFAASVAAGLTAASTNAWNAAHGWGNHADAGYLTTYTETDPLFAASTAAGLTAASTNAWNAKLDGSGTANYLPKFTASGTVGDSAIVSDADGKVGIGTLSPSHQLTIVGPSAATGTGILKLSTPGAAQGETNALSLFSTFQGTADNIPRRTADILAGFNGGSWGTEYLALGVGANGTFNDGGNVTSEKMRIQANGNVGIGTNAPAYKLDVAGSLNASGITIGGVPVASSTDTYWSTNAVGNGAIQYSGGNVGIGTATPAASAALEVTATDKGMLVPRLTLAQRDAVASPATGLLIYQTDNTPGFYFYDGAQWSSISAGAGAVTAVAASSPLSSSGGSTPTLSMPAATASANGYLTSANWTTFNAKESALTFSTPLSRSVNAISIPVATTSASGYLSSTDWTAFNAKAGAGANSNITSLTGLTTDLSVAQGGTGASTLSGVVHGNGTSALTASAVALASEVSGTLPVANGGTGAATASAARSALGAASSGANSDITSLTGLTTDLSVAQGGTGASTLSGVVHGNGTSAMTASAVALASEVSGTLPVANGGTGAATASAARSALGAASSGANSDITSLSGLTTDLSVAQGGTGASTLSGVVHGNGTSAMTASAVALASEVSGTLPVANGGTGAATASAARSALGAAASGANSDITSLTGLTTPLSVAQGGTGASTLTANKVVVGNGTSAVLQPTNLHWDNTNSRLGVGDATPSYAVDVAGDVNVTGALRVNGTAINSGQLDYAMVGKMEATIMNSAGYVTWETNYLRGAITMPSTTSILLKAGKTYELECVLDATGTYLTDIQYYWVTTGAVNIGNPRLIARLCASPIPAFSQPVARAVYTPAVDTPVMVRVASTPPWTISTRSYAVIRELQ